MNNWVWAPMSKGLEKSCAPKAHSVARQLGTSCRSCGCSSATRTTASAVTAERRFLTVLPCVFLVSERFFFLLVVFGHRQSPRLIGGLIAFPAVNWLRTVGLERHLRLNTARGAGRRIHLALSAAITTTTAVATATTTAAAALLGCIPARLTFAGFLKPFGSVKFLLFSAKRKLGSASRTGELFVCNHGWLRPLLVLIHLLTFGSLSRGPLNRLRMNKPVLKIVISYYELFS